MTDGIVTEPAPQEDDGESEFEWRPVSGWPEHVRALRQVIEDCDEVVPLLEGAADDYACHIALDFVRAVLSQHKAALAMALLDLHGVTLPPRDGWQTPQEQIQANLRKVAEDVKKRQDIRPEDLGMKMPLASRARRTLPDMMPASGTGLFASPGGLRGAEDDEEG